MDSPEVPQLYRPLRERALARVELALKIAVLLRLNYSTAEIADLLAVTPRDIRRAIDDLQAVADEVKLGERPGDAD